MKRIIAALTMICAWQAGAESLITTTPVATGGNQVADTFGRTLYVFDVDKGKPAPACINDCVDLWPPYVITEVEAKQLQAPLGAIKRTSQQLQLTVDGRPVYTFASDRKPGDSLGDGLGKVWHIIKK